MKEKKKTWRKPDRDAEFQLEHQNDQNREFKSKFVNGFHASSFLSSCPLGITQSTTNMYEQAIDQ